jgi:S-adenosyl-L-methionine hydrolase (adenosine-forming)
MARAYHRSITTPAAARMTRAGARPFVSLLTDFGARDPSAGICRAVVAGIAPEASIVDISHDVEKYAVRDAALLLWCAVPYLPIGAHVAVVDPGVGTERRAIALETARGDYLVGPDNGILLPAASRLGGILRAHQLENPQYRLPVISTSFHGRDVFAPAAAHLALGVPLEFMGNAVDPRTLVLLDWPEPEVYDGLLRASVVYLDTFGNAKLSALGGHMLNAFGGLRAGESLYVRLEEGEWPRDLRLPWVGTFGQVPVGQPLLYEDSYGRVCIAVNRGSAVRTLDIRQDVSLTLTRSPMPSRSSTAVPSRWSGESERSPNARWRQAVRGPGVSDASAGVVTGAGVAVESAVDGHPDAAEGAAIGAAAAAGWAASPPDETRPGAAEPASGATWIASDPAAADRASGTAALDGEAAAPFGTGVASGAAEQEPVPVIDSPVDPEAAPAIDSPVDPEAVPAIATPAEPEPVPTVDSPADSELASAIDTPADPEAAPSVDTPADPEAAPAIDSSVDPEAAPTVDSSVDSESASAIQTPAEPEGDR